MNNYDHKAREDFKTNSASVVSWILLASFGYYNYPENPSLLSDEVFDKMCKHYLDNYDNIKHSKFDGIITKSHLEAGSLYDLHAYEYPAQLIPIYNKLVGEL